MSGMNLSGNLIKGREMKKVFGKIVCSHVHFGFFLHAVAADLPKSKNPAP
jgi:hypothetical protein